MIKKQGSVKVLKGHKMTCKVAMSTTVKEDKTEGKGNTFP